MVVQITELLGRSDTGVSVKPFICKTEHGDTIFIKPYGTLPKLLIAEWIGGRLAQEFNLPYPKIAIVNVPSELAQANHKDDWSDFKAGIGFGSYTMGNRYRDLQSSDITKFPSHLLAEVLLFDYWIKNNDRMMSSLGGNPNTLVSADVSELCIIDHDSAFDADFCLRDFKLYHLARSDRGYWNNKRNKQNWLRKAEEALTMLEKIWAEIPDDWFDSSLDNHTQPQYSLAYYKAILNRPFEEVALFWKELLL